MRATKKADIKRLPVKEDMTIYHAVAQKRQFLTALKATGHLELDLHGVTELDTAGLQLLMLLKREAGQLGKTLSMIGHGPRVQQILDFCNLASAFGDPMVISASASSSTRQN